MFEYFLKFLNMFKYTSRGLMCEVISQSSHDSNVLDFASSTVFREAKLRRFWVSLIVYSFGSSSLDERIRVVAQWKHVASGQKSVSRKFNTKNDANDKLLVLFLHV